VFLVNFCAVTCFTFSRRNVLIYAPITAAIDQRYWVGSLSWHAHCGHAEVVGVLLRAGCGRNRAMRHGETPLYSTAMNGHAQVLRALIKAGCDKDKAMLVATACCCLLLRASALP
jgi:hypothetical protein